MTPAYQCPKSHGSDFVLISKTHRIEPRNFLWLTWIEAVHTGYIVRCPDHGCARIWRIGLDGVHEPAGTGNVERPTQDAREAAKDAAERDRSLGLIERPDV